MKSWNTLKHQNDLIFARLSKTFLRISTIALVSVLMPQIASASTTAITSASAGGYPMPVLPGKYMQDSGSNGQSSEASSNISNAATVYSGAAPYPPVGTQSAQASAYAYSTEGLLRASVSAGAETAGIVYNAASADSWSAARWDDYLTVNAGNALQNQLGYVHAQMIVSGNYGGSPGAYGQMTLGVRLSGTGMARDNTNCGGWAYCAIERASNGAYFNGPQISINTFPGVVSLIIPVYFGKSTTIGYGVDLYATANALTLAQGNPTGAGAFADFSHTFSWGGISGVFDANGNQINSFSVSSSSGFDYLHPAPVPVPAAAWLLGSGALALLGVARRRRGR